jgi:O-antigen ligase
LGYGLDFDVTFQIGRSPIHTPHNILLAALVRGGILALAALAAALIGAVAAAVAAARKGWWLPLVVLTSSLALSAVDHEMVPTSFGFYWYVFWLPLGLAAAAAAEPSSGNDA